MRPRMSGYAIFPPKEHENCDGRKLPKGHDYWLFCLFRTNRYSVNSIGSRFAGILFHSFRNQNRSQKNTITVNSVYSHSGIVPKEHALRFCTWSHSQQLCCLSSRYRWWTRKLGDVHNPKSNRLQRHGPDNLLSTGSEHRYHECGLWRQGWRRLPAGRQSHALQPLSITRCCGYCEKEMRWSEQLWTFRYQWRVRWCVSRCKQILGGELRLRQWRWVKYLRGRLTHNSQRAQKLQPPFCLPSKVRIVWVIFVIHFHPSHRLFSRLRNHSTVSLTIPLGD